MSELGGHAEARIGAHYCLAQKRLAQGDVDGARAEMEKSDQAAHHPTVSPLTRAVHVANHIMFALQQDDLSSALDWGNRLSEYPDDTLGVWQQHVPPRLLIARGDKTAAAERLHGLYQRAADADAQGFMIKIRVYQALAAASPAEALSFLAEALEMGQSEDFVRTFVDEGRFLAPLLRQAIAQGISAEYARKLVGIIEAEEQVRKEKRGEAIPTLQPAGLLSERELEVLRLLAGGLSNRQVANKLFISLGTVKVHVHNICQKLDVTSRTQAIARARELKLV